MTIVMRLAAIILDSMYYSHVASLLLSGGAIAASIGACRIYYIWNSGKGNIEHEIAQWLAGIIFLLCSGLAIGIIFGF